MAKFANNAETTQATQPAPAAAPSPPSGWMGTAPAAEVRPPAVAASPEFVFYALPDSYQILEKRVVPVLRKFKLQHGVNGVTQLRTPGKPPVTQWRAAFEDLVRQQGAIPVPRDIDGPGTDYAWRPEGTDAWLTRWERVSPGSRRITSDVAAFAEWAESLVTRGLIPAPSADILRELEAEQLRRLDELRNADGAIRPGNERRAQEIQASIDAIAAKAVA